MHLNKKQFFCTKLLQVGLLFDKELQLQLLTSFVNFFLRDTLRQIQFENEIEIRNVST